MKHIRLLSIVIALTMLLTAAGCQSDSPSGGEISPPPVSGSESPDASPSASGSDPSPSGDSSGDTSQEEITALFAELDALARDGDPELAELLYFGESNLVSADNLRAVLSDPAAQRLWRTVYAPTDIRTGTLVAEVPANEDSGAWAEIEMHRPEWYLIDYIARQQSDYGAPLTTSEGLQSCFEACASDIPLYLTTGINIYIRDGKLLVDGNEFLMPYMALPSSALEQPVDAFLMYMSEYSFEFDWSSSLSSLSEGEQQAAEYLTMISEYRFGDALRFAQECGNFGYSGDVVARYETLSDADRMMVDDELSRIPASKLIVYKAESAGDTVLMGILLYSRIDESVEYDLADRYYREAMVFRGGWEGIPNSPEFSPLEDVMYILGL